MAITPGPWECSGPEVLQADDPTKHIATCWNHDTIDPAESEENARLIAGSPALLEACETVLNRLDYLRNLWGDEGVTRSLCDQVRAAVASAKGGP